MYLNPETKSTNVQPKSCNQSFKTASLRKSFWAKKRSRKTNAAHRSGRHWHLVGSTTSVPLPSGTAKRLLRGGGRGSQLRGRLRTRGRWSCPDTNEVIPDSVVDELIIHGSYDQCRDHIQAYMDGGAQIPSLAIIPFGVDMKDAIEGLAPRR